MTARRRTPKWIRETGQRLSGNPVSVAVLSQLSIWYLRFVCMTNRFIVDPPDILETVKPEQPVIVAVWHGQHVLLPAIPIGLNAAVMISRNFDGEVTARVVKHFGNKTIRASGGRLQQETLRKGGISGFLEMLDSLKRGENVVQTADIPRGIARQAGKGIITLAQRSGRPIIPLAIASSRRHVFKKSWDKTTFNLPFGTSAICAGDFVHVPANATESELEESRKLLEDELNRATFRAYEMTGNRE